MLEFSSVVLPAPSPYRGSGALHRLTTVHVANDKHCSTYCQQLSTD